jgi:hypothetical protein
MTITYTTHHTTHDRTRDIALDSAGSARRQTLGRAISSEWIKFRTLRSNWISLASVVAILVGVGALAAAMATGSVAPPTEAGGGPFGGSDPLSTVLTGSTFAVLLAGIIGSLAGAREYGSRMIAATVAAVPRRWQVVISKAVVYGIALFTTAVVGVMGAYGVGMGILVASDSATVALSDDGVLRALLGMAGYLTAIGFIGLGLGVLLRSVSGSIGALVAGVLVLPTLVGALLPDSWDPILQYLPSSAAAAFTTVPAAGTEVLSAGAGAAVLAAWAIAVLGGAIASISRRDV